MKCYLLSIIIAWLVFVNTYGQGEKLILWSEEFDGPKLDTSEWIYQTGSHGWGNNEWQEYTKGENISIDNGILSIVAKKIGAGQKVGDYTSTRLKSKKTFQYGRIEIRAKMPEHKGNGLWPAIWMLGENIKSVGWPSCGELDIMEYVSYDPDYVHQTIHTAANNHTRGNHISSGRVSLPTIEESFHVYGLLWLPDRLVFYVDNESNVLLEVRKPQNPNPENWPFDHPFYFVLNMAVGGNWGGAQGVDDNIFPASFQVDYVRVYALKSD